MNVLHKMDDKYVTEEFLEELRPHFESALSTLRELNEIWADLLAGKAQLWLVVTPLGKVQGVGCTKMIERADKNVVLILVYSNSSAGTFLSHWPSFEQWCRDWGADEIEFYGRRGWEKALKTVGFEFQSITMNMKLEK